MTAPARDGGVCACGCGRQTTRWDRNVPARGVIKGDYRRFAPGHTQRGVDWSPLPPPAALPADRQPVPGFSGYVATPGGDIYGPRRRQPLAPEMIKGGYQRVSMRDDDGRRRHVLVHRAVAATFLGPCPEGYEVNHKNGVTSANRVSNLEYKTPSQNVRHSIDVLGRKRAPGEKNANALLTDDAVRRMRIAAAGGAALRDLVVEYGVSYSQVSRVVSRRAWRHVA